MTLGIIGAGRIGQAVARVAVRAGRAAVISNSAGPGSLQTVARELGAGIRAGSVREAAEQDMVVLAVPWGRVEKALEGLPAWNGRIVVDATNALIEPDFRAADLGGSASSQVVASLVPGARVVKGFNTLVAAVLGSDPRIAGGQRVLFYSGDDLAAKQAFHQLITEAGFAGIDLGSLAASRVQQFPGGPLAAINLIKLP
jgi:predicted dinucleotide-binding enzyme